MSIQEIVSYKGDKGTFKVLKPIRRELSEDKFDGVDKG